MCPVCYAHMCASSLWSTCICDMYTCVHVYHVSMCIVICMCICHIYVHYIYAYIYDISACHVYIMCVHHVCMCVCFMSMHVLCICMRNVFVGVGGWVNAGA